MHFFRKINQNQNILGKDFFLCMEQNFGQQNDAKYFDFGLFLRKKIELHIKSKP